jgi:hypothetical protein
VHSGVWAGQLAVVVSSKYEGLHSVVGLDFSIVLNGAFAYDLVNICEPQRVVSRGWMQTLDAPRLISRACKAATN